MSKLSQVNGLQTNRPIDAVITWVDGQDPEHIKLRAQYSENSPAKLSAEIHAARRWSFANEIDICLRSLERNAPWLRKIFIITNGQIPNGLDALPDALRAKIEIIDHKVIFEGHLDWLPTFNSIAIETMMWRIKGLSERFIYFNDDMFLAGACKPEFFFPDINGQDELTALLGKWISIPNDKVQKFCKNIHRCVKLNAALAYNYKSPRFFSCAHVAIPMRVSEMKAIFEAHPEWLAKNASAKFRDHDQYLVQGLFAHHLLEAGRAVIPPKCSTQNLSAAYCKRVPFFVYKINCALMRKFPQRYRLICINDLTLLNKRYKGKADGIIRKTIGI